MSLKALCLPPSADNNLGPDGAKLVSQLLSENASLRTLNLTGGPVWLRSGGGGLAPPTVAVAVGSVCVSAVDPEPWPGANPCCGGH